MTEIPLTTDAEQIFETDLNGERYFFTVRLNYGMSLWTLDMADENGLLIAGAPMVTGKNMLYNDRTLTRRIGELWLFDTSGLGESPTPENLGSDVLLYYFEPGESVPLPPVQEDYYDFRIF